MAEMMSTSVGFNTGTDVMEPSNRVLCLSSEEVMLISWQLWQCSFRDPNSCKGVENVQSEHCFNVACSSLEPSYSKNEEVRRILCTCNLVSCVCQALTQCAAPQQDTLSRHRLASDFLPFQNSSCEVTYREHALTCKNLRMAFMGQN